MEFKDFDLKTVGHGVTMVGGVWGGNGNVFVCLFPESNDAADGADTHVFPMNADEWTLLLKHADLVETEVLEQAQDGKLYKAIVRKCQRTIDSKVSWNVYRRDGYRCRYCGNDKCPLTVDHLVLWEEGGPSSTENNLVASCRKCNKVRGNKQYGDWLKHPFYRENSKKLTAEVRAANETVLGTLEQIPRVFRKRKKR